MFDWFSDRLSEFAAWLWDALLAFFEWIWAGVLDALAAVLEAIPVPDFFANLGSMFSQIPPGVAFFLGMLELPYGVSAMLGAYMIRFGIRRLPVIG